MPKRKGSYGDVNLKTAINLYDESGRPVGERMNNPMSERHCKEVNMLDEAVRDGAHVMVKMGMAPKR